MPAAVIRRAARRRGRPEFTHRVTFWPLLLALVWMSARPAGAQPRQDAPAPIDLAIRLQDAFAGVAARVFPSVVLVTSYMRTPPNAPKKTPTPAEGWQESEAEGYPGFTKLVAGSGFFVDGGRVVSLRQFVTQPDGAFADLVDLEAEDGTRALAQIVGVEPTLNLAVLEYAVALPNAPRKTTPVTLGDSDSMQVGHWALALGDPSGPGKVFVPGSVSATPERECYQDQMSATFMLVSSPGLHPEAYGGPIVNIRGQVIGISVPRRMAGVIHTGLEYTLPINIVMPVVKGIAAQQSARSPWLGVSVLEKAALRDQFTDPKAFEALPKPRIGIYVDNVFEPSPAARAGVRVGDFLVRLNGTLLTSVYRFQEQLYLAGIGREAEVEVFRAGQARTLRVTVEVRPPAAVPR